MDEFERRLRAALEREPAPDGFAGRVLARAERRPVERWWRTPVARWSIAAALVVACVFTGTTEYQQQERVRGERARDEVLLALRITGSKLRAVQVRVVPADRERGGQQ
jgi:negative regulator of sigma E activity